MRALLRYWKGAKMGMETTTVETTKYEDGSTSEITTTVEAEYTGSSDTVEDISTEIVEPKPTVSDAVAIAAIEAETQVAIAEITAETTLAVIEAEQEREISWQDEVAILRANMLEQAATIAMLMERFPAEADPSTLEASTEATALTVEEVEASNSIPPSTSELTEETLMEVTPESVEEKPVVVILPEPPAKRKRRLI